LNQTWTCPSSRLNHAVILVVVVQSKRAWLDLYIEVCLPACIRRWRLSPPFVHRNLVRIQENLHVSELVRRMGRLGPSRKLIGIQIGSIWCNLGCFESRFGAHLLDTISIRSSQHQELGHESVWFILCLGLKKEPS